MIKIITHKGRDPRLSPNFDTKRTDFLINVSREESLYLRDHGVHVVVLNKYANARKKKFVVPEDRLTARLLDQYHKEQRRNG